MSKRKYYVDRLAEDCVSVYPAKQGAVLKQVKVKKRTVTMYDYGDNGFSLLPPSLGKQQGTVFKIKDMPFVTIYESKNMYICRIAFTKPTRKDALKVVKRDYKQWFAFLEQHHKEAETADE